MAHLLKRLVVVGLALAGIGAEPATAGTFHVYGLGLNGAGCPNGWQAQQIPADRFRQGNYCSRWEIQSAREGSLQRGDFAGTSMFAGAGARFTGFSIKSHGTARNGTTWKMAMCQTPFAGCTALVPAVGLVGRDRVPARHPGGRVRRSTRSTCGQVCRATTRRAPTPASAGRAVQMTHIASHAVVDDYTQPGAPSLGGVSTGWNSGQKQLSYSASDAGSGIESVTLTVDDSLHRTNHHSCSRLPAGGYTRASAVPLVDERELQAERARPACRWPTHTGGQVTRRRRHEHAEDAGVLGGQQRARASAWSGGRGRRRVATDERLLGDVAEPGSGEWVGDCGRVLQDRICSGNAD